MNKFEIMRIRVAAIVQCEDEVALIHRKKNGEDSYTVPGGNTDDGEEIPVALERELKEELNIDFPLFLEDPTFLGFQDQMVSRPGTTPPPRKLHVIFGVIIDSKNKYLLPKIESDDLGDGNIVWMKIKDAEKVHLYPAVGEVFKHLADNLGESKNSHKRLAPKLLPSMTDKNFVWK
jgi:8-oxo-dGTP diphosphatase